MIGKTPLQLIAAMVLLMLAGCGRKQSEWLAVTDDPEALARARELAGRLQDQEIETLLAHLDASLLDADAIAVLKGKKGPWLDQFRQIAHGDPVTDKAVGAAMVLWRLEDDAGRSEVRRILARGRPEQRQKLLELMNFSTAPMESFAADEPLQKLLLAQLEDRDPDVVEAAVQVCGEQEIPGATTKLAALLADPRDPGRERVCYWLSRRAPRPAHVEAVLTTMTADEGGDDRPWWAWALLYFAKCDDPATSQRAVAVLRDQRGSEAWNRVDPYIQQQVTEALIERSAAEDVPWLTSLLKGKLPDYSKCRVMLALDRLDGPRGERLLAALDDPKLRSYAAAALGEMAEDSKDRRIVKRLKTAAADEDRTNVLAAIAQALLEVGGDEARTTAIALAGRLEPSARMTVLWKANGWNAASVMDKIVGTGVLDEPAYRKALKDLGVEPDGGRDGDGSLLGVLWTAKVFLAFDVETGMLPCRHDQLLLDFARSSRGIFTPEAVCQQWHQRDSEDFGADYTLQFIFDGRLYRVRLRNQDDWYDVERLVLAVNRALQDAGHAERFHVLSGGGQIAEFVFATPEAAEKLARDVYLPVDQDLDQAIREGKEFEQRVLEEYGGDSEGIVVQ